MSRSPLAPVPCILVPFVMVCTCCAGLVAGARNLIRSSLAPSSTPVVYRPAAVSTEAIDELEQATVPLNDPLDLAGRLKDLHNISPTVPPPAAPFQPGDRQKFWVSNQDTSLNSQVEATLVYVTPHVYFWVQDGVDYNMQDLRTLVDTFENKIYPTDRQYFGSEWSPGVDGDVHLYILYASGLGSTIAGYFSTPDEYPPEAHPYSNAHEMFMINADNQNLSDRYTYGVLAHEFQHMIHWYRDPNEATWMNEGFSELASFLNGYYESGFDARYARNPDIQLNDWPENDRLTFPHYGASFLFLDYFLDRFGASAIQSVVGDPLNGLESIDDVLQKTGATDPLSGKPIRADDVFQDWTLASYIHDPSVPDGRYTYHNYPSAPSTKATEKVSSCPSQPAARSVHQYGVDYIRITCKGDYTLRFEGSTQVELISGEVHTGSYAFWSNEGDTADTTLTQAFDFTGKSGQLTLSYWTWYIMEDGFDYAYLEASTDQVNWTVLQTPACTSADLSGNSYGCGYTGQSGGGSQAQWIQQTVDLSHYAGRKVWLRFEMITDAAVNLDGFLLDDLSIPEIGYTTSFEQNDSGWQAAGFVRIENVLPQTFRLAVIYKGKATRVEYIALAADETADIPLTIGGDVSEAVLVVSGTTRFTRQLATYSYTIR